MSNLKLSARNQIWASSGAPHHVSTDPEGISGPLGLPVFDWEGTDQTLPKSLKGAALRHTVWLMRTVWLESLQ